MAIYNFPDFPTLEAVRHRPTTPREVAWERQQAELKDAGCQEAFDAIQDTLSRTDIVGQSESPSIKHTSFLGKPIAVQKQTDFSDGTSLTLERDLETGKLIEACYGQYRISTVAKAPDVDAVAAGGWMAKLALVVGSNNPVPVGQMFFDAKGIEYTAPSFHGVVKVGGSRVLEETVVASVKYGNDVSKDYLGSVIPENEQKRQAALAQDWLIR